MQWLECLLCLHVCCQGYSASGLGGDSSLSGHKTQESESGLLPRLNVRGFFYITVHTVRPNKKKKHTIHTLSNERAYFLIVSVLYCTSNGRLAVHLLAHAADALFLSSESEVRPGRLLTWCQKQTQGYRGVDVTNLTSSWWNGLALCALIHRQRPELM